MNSAPAVGTLTGSLGVFALFFLGEVPRIRNDILRQLPFFDNYFDRRLAPEDNVSLFYIMLGSVDGRLRLTDILSQPF